MMKAVKHVLYIEAVMVVLAIHLPFVVWEAFSSSRWFSYSGYGQWWDDQMNRLQRWSEA